MHKGHDHPSGTNGSAPITAPVPAAAPATVSASTSISTMPPQRTTSAFTTTSQTADSLPGRSPPTRQSTSSDGGWGSMAGPTTPSETLVQELDLVIIWRWRWCKPPVWAGRYHSSTTGCQWSDEVITISSLPEKEGMFLFQHRNYQVTSARRNSKVIRRYSDFVWAVGLLAQEIPFPTATFVATKSFASKFATDPLACSIC